MKLSITIISIILLQYFVSLTLANPFAKDLSRGFGSHIHWVALEDGLVNSHKNNMPLMLLIHSYGCPACDHLKTRFAKNPDITSLAPYFQMVNCIGDEEPIAPEFIPDGKRYYPRILFLTPDGKVVPELTNKHTDMLEKFPYYYYTAEQVVEGMLHAMNTFYEFEEDNDL